MASDRENFFLQWPYTIKEASNEGHFIIWPSPLSPHSPLWHTDLHVVKGDANFLVEVRAEKGDLGVPLTEVVQHDEPSIHSHPHINSLGGGAVAKKKARNSLGSGVHKPVPPMLTTPRKAGRSPQKTIASAEMLLRARACSHFPRKALQ